MSVVTAETVQPTQPGWIVTGTSTAGSWTHEKAEALVQARIARVVNAWLDATILMSSLHDVRRDPNYQLLANLGWPAVSVLLGQISGGRARIQCAELLTEITGDNPAARVVAGRADLIGQAWLSWGRRQGFIAA